MRYPRLQTLEELFDQLSLYAKLYFYYRFYQRGEWGLAITFTFLWLGNRIVLVALDRSSDFRTFSTTGISVCRGEKDIYLAGEETGVDCVVFKATDQEIRCSEMGHCHVWRRLVTTVAVLSVDLCQFGFGVR